MSALTDRLRDLYDNVQSPSVYEAADLIDAIDAAVSDEWSTDASKIISIYRLLHPEVET